MSESVNDQGRDEFYIGYLPTAPGALALWLRGKLKWLLLVMVGLPLALVLSMGEFSQAVFEFGDIREFTGVVREQPYPVLVVRRPRAEGADVEEQSSFLLVSSGKWGAGQDVAGLDGSRVRLEGTLIYRDGQTMLEVVGGSVEVLATGAASDQHELDLGLQTLRGEIVDSKCFLGVMKPGNLKPHRACATRCISGGIPPVLLLRDSEGRATYLLLVSADGRAVNKAVLDLVAEPIEVTGRVMQRGGLLFLHADPKSYKRLP